MTKQEALVKKWRHAANEATTSDAAVTYTECADALAVAIAVKMLYAICEGCNAKHQMPTTKASKQYPDLPPGLSQCGMSRHAQKGRVRLAAWCPTCRANRPVPYAS